jgi:hypothetical protein
VKSKGYRGTSRREYAGVIVDELVTCGARARESVVVEEAASMIVNLGPDSS